MVAAVFLSILYAIGFVVFGAVLALPVSYWLEARISARLKLRSRGKPARELEHEYRRLVYYTAILTSAIVCGVLGLIAMAHDGPISHYW